MEFFELADKLTKAADEFYQKAEEADPVLFLSMVAMLIERKCADNELDVIEMMEYMVQVAKEINSTLGETTWGKVNG